MHPNFLIIFGILMGIALGAAYASYINFAVLPIEIVAFLGSLFGAAGAIVGAWFVADHQLKMQAELRNAELKRRRLGALSLLAMDLSSVLRSLESAANALRRVARYKEGADVDDLFEPATDIELEVVLRLERLVGLLEPEDADKIVDLIHVLQIFTTRFEDINDALKAQSYIQLDQIMSGRELTAARALLGAYVRAEAMFPFTRRETVNIEGHPFSDKFVYSGVRTLRLDEWVEPGSINSWVGTLSGLKIGAHQSFPRF